MKSGLNIRTFALLKLLLAVSLFFSFTLKHPFYLGVTDLKYNAKEKSMQGSIKLFTNDLEEAIKQVYKVKVDLINGKDKASLEKILGDYVNNHLKLKVNAKALACQLIGFEHESEAIWMYIEFKSCATPKKVNVENSLLYDNVKTQINIVHCDVNGNTKSSKVTNPERTILFEF